MADALNVARYFINLSSTDSESITNLKLQKLLYYAQGFSLGLEIGPLFSEPIQAWAHGPVVPVVYHEFKHFGSNEIRETYDLPEEAIKDYEANIIKVTWEIFKKHSGKVLEQMTHSEDPWKNARKGLGELEPSNKEIDIESIKDFFKKEYIKSN